MELYGSQLFGSIKFRDSYVMLGQRGVAKGKAIELVERKKNKDFAGAAKLTGCASFPRKLLDLNIYFDPINVKISSGGSHTGQVS